MPVNAAKIKEKKQKQQNQLLEVKIVWRQATADEVTNRECFLEFEQQATADEMKEKIKEKFDVDKDEQLLMFRGIIFKEDEKPFGDPDLLKKADDLEIWIMEQKLRYKPFCKAERFKTINEKNKYGCTVLHRACVKAECTIVEELLAKKNFKEVNAVDKVKMTALHRAILCRFKEICLILLQHPRFTALNQSDHDKRNVLHHAAIWGNADVCKAIIARPEFKSTSHHKRDVYGRTALECAEERGHNEAAEVLRAAMPELPPEDEEDAEQPTEANEEKPTTAKAEVENPTAAEGDNEKPDKVSMPEPAVEPPKPSTAGTVSSRSSGRSDKLKIDAIISTGDQTPRTRKTLEKMLENNAEASDTADKDDADGISDKPNEERADGASEKPDEEPVGDVPNSSE